MKQLPVILLGLCILIVFGFCAYYAYNLFVKSGTEFVFVTSQQKPVVEEEELKKTKDDTKVLNGFEIWQKEVNISYAPEVKDLNKIIADKEAELAKDPDNNNLVYSIGYYYLIDGDIISAMNKFKELAIEGKGKDELSAKLARAYIYYLNKEYDTALTMINEVEKADPGNKDLLLVKAVFNKLQGKKKEALKYYSSALKKDPTNVSIQKAIKELN